MTRPTFARACLRGLLGFTGLITLALVIAAGQITEAAPAPTDEPGHDDDVSQAQAKRGARPMPATAKAQKVGSMHRAGLPLFSTAAFFNPAQPAEALESSLRTLRDHV